MPGCERHFFFQHIWAYNAPSIIHPPGRPIMNDHSASDALPTDPTGPAAPPTVRGAQPAAPRPSSWPTVLGVIAIVLGALAVVGAVWQLVMPFVLGTFLDSLSAGQTADPFAIQRNPWMLVIQVIGLILAGVLIAIGVMLLQRRRRARRLGLAWAGIDIIHVFVGVGTGYLLQQAQWAQQQQSGTGTAAIDSSEQIGALIGLGIGLIFGCALPVFMLIWLKRPKIKDEMMQWP